MRITNRMMTNNMLSNISANKNRLSTLEEQYSTGLKIQKPSEDPIVAVRALKLRTNLSELNQYYEKNIPDAKAWMDVTEGAMKVVSDILQQMNTYCVQGSNDTLTKNDRDSIAKNLEQLKDQIYQEGNSNYAGRYVFTGYKTDTSLVFDDITSNLHYTMREQFTANSIDMVQKPLNPVSIEQYNADTPEDSDLANKPNMTNVYRLQLAYDELLEEEAPEIMLNPERDEDGNIIYDEDGSITYEDSFSSIITVSKDDENAYLPGEGEIHFIAETGELILAEDVYTEWSNSEAEIHVTYQKNRFQKNDLRPEHYFDCVRTELNSEGEMQSETEVSFRKADQKIEYEVNFNQRLDINTQGHEAITHSIARTVDDVLSAINSLDQTEKKIAETEKLLLDEQLTKEQKTALEEMLEMMETEKTIREEVLQSTFEKAVTGTQKQQDYIGVALADLGSRYVRLELTESRLSLQQDDFTDLLSKNEDADVVETIINFSAQEAIYNSSLNAASKVVQNSLLDFL